MTRAHRLDLLGRALLLLWSIGEVSRHVTVGTAKTFILDLPSGDSTVKAHLDTFAAANNYAVEWYQPTAQLAAIATPEGVTRGQLLAALSTAVPSTKVVQNFYFTPADDYEVPNVANSTPRRLRSQTRRLPAVNVTDGLYSGRQLWGLKLMEAQAAWERGITGKCVRIAILDAGMPPHVDLPNIDTVASKSYYENEGLNYTQDSIDPRPRPANHVACIAAAAANNGGPMVGVAPGATVIAVKIGDGLGPDFSRVLQGVVYAATPRSEGGAGAHIINFSFGQYLDASDNDIRDIIKIWKKTTDSAARRGVLFVAAAGNNALDLGKPIAFPPFPPFPPSFPPVPLPPVIRNPAAVKVIPCELRAGLCVASVAPNGYCTACNPQLPQPPQACTAFNRSAACAAKLASYSNYGDGVDVAAPGGERCLPGPNPNPCCQWDAIWSCGPQNGYIARFGTGMAAPHVVGAAALIIEAQAVEKGINICSASAKLPGSVDQLKKLITRTAVGPSYELGAGVVNVKNAMNAIFKKERGRKLKNE